MLTYTSGSGTFSTATVLPARKTPPVGGVGQQRKPANPWKVFRFHLLRHPWCGVQASLQTYFPWLASALSIKNCCAIQQPRQTYIEVNHGSFRPSVCEGSDLHTCRRSLRVRNDRMWPSRPLYNRAPFTALGCSPSQCEWPVNSQQLDRNVRDLSQEHAHLRSLLAIYQSCSGSEQTEPE